MKTVVKVQVPLDFKTGVQLSAGEGLVYAKGKVNMRQQQLDAKIIAALNGDPKGYFVGEFIAGQWKIGQRVGDESW